MWLNETAGVDKRLCILFAALGLLAAAALGCGGGDSSDASADQASETSIPTSAPPLEVPAGLPPKKLVVKDLFKGTGAEANKGDEVALHYYCLVWENNFRYANSWNYPKAPTFVLGKHQLLRGLTLAVPGMKEGGGREVLIPHNLLYYPNVQHEPSGVLAALFCKVYLVKVLQQKS